MTDLTTDDVRQWLKTIDGQQVSEEMVKDLILSLEAALDFIDEMKDVKKTDWHPLYP